jgi:hypothetical protein
MGKVSPQDFEEMADRLRARALGIMKQLDAGAKVYRELIEKELAARTGNKPVVEVPVTREVPITRVPELQVGHCACGTSNDADARFCKSCGARLQAAS